MHADNAALSGCIELRSASSSKDLNHVQNVDIAPSTARSIVELRSFNDNAVGGKIHTPCQRGCAANHAQNAFSEHFFNERSIRATHSCVMNSNTTREKLLQLSVVRSLNTTTVIAIFFMVDRGLEEALLSFLLGVIEDFEGGY